MNPTKRFPIANDRSSNVTISSDIREYAQGAAQQAISPVAEFIAPTVEVSTPTGQYKSWDIEHQFRIPDTKRQSGGRAAQLGFDASDNTFNCTHHAVDFPLDIIDSMPQEAAIMTLQDAADINAQIAGLSHAKTVIDQAAAAATASSKVWDSNADPIDDIDDGILTVLKIAAFGDLMGAGILFGATAWKIFKNHSAVRNKFVVSTSKAAGVGLAQPTIAASGELFLSNPAVRQSFMVYNSAAVGKTDSNAFLFDSKVLIFARMDKPSRFDPSFMKTFRLRGRWMIPGVYEREDGRAQVAKMDWSEDVVTTNTPAGLIYTVSES